MYKLFEEQFVTINWGFYEKLCTNIVYDVADSNTQPHTYVAVTLAQLPLALFRQLALPLLDLDLLLTQLSRVDARLVEQFRQEVLAVGVVERRLEAIDLDARNLPSLHTHTNKQC